MNLKQLNRCIFFQALSKDTVELEVIKKKYMERQKVINELRAVEVCKLHFDILAQIRNTIDVIHYIESQSLMVSRLVRNFFMYHCLIEALHLVF